MAKFKASSKGGVRIVRPGGFPPIVVPGRGGSYETNDKAEIRALKASPEVVEVKEKRSG